MGWSFISLAFHLLDSHSPPHCVRLLARAPREPTLPSRGCMPQDGSGGSELLSTGPEEAKGFVEEVQGLSGRVGIIRCIDHRPQVGKPRPQEHRCICRLRAAGAGPSRLVFSPSTDPALQTRVPICEISDTEPRTAPAPRTKCPPFSLPA